MPSFIRRAVDLLLALCILVTTPVPLFAKTFDPQPAPDFAAWREISPLFDTFARARIDASLSGIWSVAELDLDPYLMRGQRYVDAITTVGAAREVTDGEERVRYEVGPGHVTLQLPRAARALRLERGLAPLFALDQYLFFKPNDVGLFRGLLESGEDSQGLFFIDVRLARTALQTADGTTPTPVFFLPLAGSWVGAVQALHDDSTGTLAFNNGAGHSATISREGFDHYAKLQAFNLQLTQLIARRHGETLPPRGSTFGFGAWVTGIDLDHPERGVARPKSTFALSLDLLPKAHAAPGDDSYGSLLRLMIMVGAAWTTSTLAQMTVLRPRLLERRAYIENIRPPRNPGARGYKVFRAVKENFDIMAHAMGVIGNGAQTTGTYLLEYALDRTGTRAAQSGWARRGFEGTFGYIRRFYEWTATSAWVAFAAIFIDGGVDVTTHLLALFYASPIVLPAIAGWISTARRERAAAEFAGQDAFGNALMWNEAKYQIAMTAVQAPYAKAAEQRRALMEVVKTDVSKRFRPNGINPVDPGNFDAIDEAIDKRVEQMMIERGYPSRPEFIASSPSIVRAFAAKLGYRVKDRGEHTFLFSQARWGIIPSVFRDAHRALTRTAKAHPDNPHEREALRLLEEMSRRYFTLREAAKNPKHAGRILREGGSVRGLMTLLSVKTTSTDRVFPLLADWKPEDRAPVERLIALRAEVTRELSLSGKTLTARAIDKAWRARARRESSAVTSVLAECRWRRLSPEDKLREIDEEAKTGLMGAALRTPEAANRVARVIQNAIANRLSGNALHLTATDADISEFGTEARREAITRLERERPKLGFGESDVAIETLEVVKRRALARDQERANRRWTPEQGDWLARRQLAAAHRAAERAIDFEIESEDPAVELRYREAFRVALAKKVGLETFEDPSAGPEYEVMKMARAAAEAELNRNLAENDAWRAYLEHADRPTQIAFAAHHYADSFLAAYTEATVSNSAFVHATSPAQPGFFQSIRRTEFARRDNWLGKATTYALRVGDSFFDATAVKPGVGHWIKRRIPLAQDLISDGEIRLRGLPTYLIFSWGWNRLLGVNFSLPVALFLWFTGGLGSTVHWWSDRVLVNVGVPPLQGFSSQFVHSILMATFGYFSAVPFFLFAEDFERGFNQGVAGCQGWLTGLVSR